jgi:hypothetical protein
MKAVALVVDARALAEAGVLERGVPVGRSGVVAGGRPGGRVMVLSCRVAAEQARRGSRAEHGRQGGERATTGDSGHGKQLWHT